MFNSFKRRAWWLGAALVGLCPVISAQANRGQTHSPDLIQKRQTPIAEARLRQLESRFGGRIGVYALDTGSGNAVEYRAGELFPLCSTFKVMAAAAILARSEREANYLGRRIQYGPSNMVEYSPITEKHLKGGMTIAELCAAALQYSDNTAGNLLMREVGGPAGVTEFARSQGDGEFRVDRWETALNTAIPGDKRDTTTPQAMGKTLQRLLLGNGLTPSTQRQLKEWMLGNTTGAARIKACIPTNWKIADKTGTGYYGTGNDVAVVWRSPQTKPIVIAIYTTQQNEDAKARNDIIAAAALIVADWAQG